MIVRNVLLFKTIFKIIIFLELLIYIQYIILVTVCYDILAIVCINLPCVSECMHVLYI